jgi:fermentation-respiration switch protein FrsA (DUF1100 family)
MRLYRLSRALGAVLAIALTLYVGMGVGLYAIQRQLIFPGQFTAVTPRPVLPARDVEPFRLATAGGYAEAWLQPPLVNAPGEKQPALIFAHGNGEVIDHWLGGLDDFRRWGMHVLLVEYPGYGRSQGSPSEAAIREVMIGAYDLLASRPDVDRQRIVGYGQSLGGGAICALARDRHLAAMILQSTFTSIRSFAERYLLPAFLVRDPFDNDQVVRHFAGPILLLHGREDALVPYQHAVALAQLSPRSALHLYDCGHGCWSPDLPILADIRRFLQTNGILTGDHDQASLTGR